MIDVRDLCLSLGRRKVLEDVSLAVAPGEVAGLLGPNGSGKTTLLLALAGALPLDSGSARVAGADVVETRPSQLARLAASVPQKAEAAFALKCGTVVLMGRYPHLGFFGSYGDQDRRLAREAMRRAGVEKLAERSVEAVSGGEYQRVLFARALAQDTEILLLDEPAASLDIAGTVRVFDTVARLAGRGGAALCAVHDLNLAALYCQRLFFLKNGRVAAHGPTKEVFNEQILSRVYETDIRVTSHPVTGAPQAHYVPLGCRDGDSGNGPAGSGGA